MKSFNSNEINWSPASPPGSSRLCSSFLGFINPPPPIVDVWIQQTMFYDGFPEQILATAYHKMNEGRHEAVVRVEYTPTSISDREAFMYAEGIKFALCEVPLSASIEDAVSLTSKYQKKLRR